MTTNYIGQARSRVDGHAKVTGAAKYAAEYNTPGLLYGVVVGSAIAKGKIKNIDAAAALAIPGVVKVFTHENRPDTAWLELKYKDMDAPRGNPFRPLRDATVYHSEQPIALVVAESFELARYAALLLKIEYDEQPHQTELEAARSATYKPKIRPLIKPPAKPRGDADSAFANADAQQQGEYTQPAEHHNPMEMHATTVVYGADGKLTIYDKTQGVHNSKIYVMNVFGLSGDKVHVISPYVGGAFGSALRPQHQLFLATMAAIGLKRSVRVTLTRQQMFSFAHRPITINDVSLGAASDGKLEAIKHTAIAETSKFEDYTENVVNWAAMLYQCANVAVDYEVAQLDLPTPGDMRAPGAPTGLWGLESAMDELAYKLNIDPLQLRLLNYAERDQIDDKPFSSKGLRECYQQAAAKFGWSRRNPEPRSMRAGNNLIGWGMATGSWDAFYIPTAAKATLTADGRLEVSSGVADIGTGTGTIMTQIAAETLGVPIDMVTFKLGDSDLPLAPIEGGSMTAASCGASVMDVCQGVGDKLFEIARKMDNSPIFGAKRENVTFADGQIRLSYDPTQGANITDVLRHAKLDRIEESTNSLKLFTAQSMKQRKYSRNTHSAVFAEVQVDQDLGTIRVTRIVSAIAAGRILNPKTARSQVLGAIVWGIGMALEEESVLDHKFGRFMNSSLAEYHVPVNADIKDLEVLFVEEKDDIVSPLGVKGVGEIGIVGVAAAIGNAVYHATGVRVRDLPITLDKLL